MIETRFWFGDASVVRLSRSEARTAQALAVFHGFPGQPPKGEEHKYANAPKMRVELAKAYVAETGFDAYLPSYEGLGASRGAFTFRKSVLGGAALCRELAAAHETLHVAGHSWGGFVGFHAHRAAGSRAGKLILLAGLLDLPNEASIRAFLPDYLTKYPEILGSDAGAFERAVSDLDATRREFNPLSHAAKRGEDELLIVHGRPDTYVDVEISRRFHRAAGGRYVEMETADHVFSGDALQSVIDRSLRFLAFEK